MRATQRVVEIAGVTERVVDVDSGTADVPKSIDRVIRGLELQSIRAPLRARPCERWWRAPHRVLSLLPLLGCLVAHPVDALGLLSDGRMVESRFCIPLITGDESVVGMQTERATPAQPFGSFAASLPTVRPGSPSAVQDSAIASQTQGLGMVWTASGRASGGVLDGPPPCQSGAETGTSRFEIGFRIDGDAFISLTGLLSGNGLFASSARLVSGTNVLYSAGTGDVIQVDAPLDYEAVLPAGEYLLEVTALASGSHLSYFGGRGAFALTFSVSDTVIPESGTGLLVGIGVAGMVAARRLTSSRPA